MLPLSARLATGSQFTIDILDVWIPAAGADLVNVSEGTLGLLGWVFTRSILTHDLSLSLQPCLFNSRHPESVEGSKRQEVEGRPPYAIPCNVSCVGSNMFPYHISMLMSVYSFCVISSMDYTVHPESL